MGSILEEADVVLICIPLSSIKGARTARLILSFYYSTDRYSLLQKEL